MIITESAITLNFPDNNYFRFQDCEGYQALSGHNFKEMDFFGIVNQKTSYTSLN